MSKFVYLQEKTMETEIWKDIVGYEGLYQVSNLGRVKSLGNGKSTNPLTNIEKILKQQPTKKGYLKIKLCNNGFKYFNVHRLVAQTFIENKKNKPQVNHIDCNKQNNRVDNLEWVTSNENIIHSVLNNLQKNKKGFESKCSKQIQQFDKNWNLIKEWGSINEACIELGINSFGIIKCCKKEKKYKTAYGYKWKYKYE